MGHQVPIDVTVLLEMPANRSQRSAMTPPAFGSISSSDRISQGDPMKIAVFSTRRYDKALLTAHHASSLVADGQE